MPGGERSETMDNFNTLTASESRGCGIRGFEKRKILRCVSKVQTSGVVHLSHPSQEKRQSWTILKKEVVPARIIIVNRK